MLLANKKKQSEKSHCKEIQARKRYCSTVDTLAMQAEEKSNLTLIAK